MPRKGKKIKFNIKNNEAVVLNSSSSCLKCARSVVLNENFERWRRIRSQCSFNNDEDFTSYLLDLVESKIKSDKIGNDGENGNVPKCIETTPGTNASTHESMPIVSQDTKKNKLRILKNRPSPSEQSSECRTKTEESLVEKGDEEERSERMGDEEKENLRVEEDTKIGTSSVVKDDSSITSRLGVDIYDSQCKQIVSSNCANSTDNSIILKETEQNQVFNKLKKHQQNKNSDKVTNVSPGKSKNCKKKKFDTLEKGKKEESVPDERLNITEPVAPVDESKVDPCAPHETVSVDGDLPLEKVSVIDRDNLTAKNHSVVMKQCGDCDSRHLLNSCPLRCPQNVVEDTVSWEQYSRDGLDSRGGDAEDSSDSSRGLQSYAFASLPGCLELRVTDSEHGLGVVTRQSVPAFTRFGPLVGRPIKQMEIPDDSSMKDIWEMLYEGDTCTYTSTEQPDASNWTRWLRPAPSRDQRNLAAVPVQLNGERRLCFVTTQPLAGGDELLYWTDQQHAWSTKKMTKTSDYLSIRSILFIYVAEVAICISHIPSITTVIAPCSMIRISV
ncbi:hypothetical protein LSTR_LSTR002223 [Laodelphax striatellus]|uniref:SET domain-containing protein n=1 Tax=Laodelphax striatellus TaxID=195883 RepID=A0A482XFU2_LAOST|nr:hypothetical protein LSTR_LSTR002223 [Laodelphax striatellus]